MDKTGANSPEAFLTTTPEGAEMPVGMIRLLLVPLDRLGNLLLSPASSHRRKSHPLVSVDVLGHQDLPCF